MVSLVKFENIIYLESMGEYVRIHTTEGKTLTALYRLKNMEAALPADTFMRVHRSYIVQPAKIRIIERGRIVFGKTYIPVSDGYKEAFYAFLEARSLMPKGDK